MTNKNVQFPGISTDELIFQTFRFKQNLTTIHNLNIHQPIEKPLNISKEQ